MPAQTQYEIEDPQVVPLGIPNLLIGDVELTLEGLSISDMHLSPAMQAFQSDHQDPDIEVRVECAEIVQPSSPKKAFESGGVWSLHRDGSDFVWDFASPSFGGRSYKRMRTSRDFGSVLLTLNQEAFAADGAPYPLEYPADELLFTNYLAHHALGVEVHGCGLIDRECGSFLFLGHSGAGKSTTTGLWNSARSPKILSDDRIILRIHDGELWMYGTPWHGEAAFASAAMAKLNRIFILQHGTQNKVVELARARAAGEMFARCFPPFHSAQGLSNTIEFLDRVVNLVPCYEFQFLPDKSAVEAALAFHG